MITDNEKWHYLAVKSVPGLLRGMTSNHDGDFYFLNCFHSCTTMNKLKKHQKIYRNHDFSYVKIPDEKLKHNPGEKSKKVPFVIYADLECILRKTNAYQVNPTKSYTVKKAKHKTSGYSLVTYCSLDKSKTECNYYRGKDCIKIFCKDLKKQAVNIINHEKEDIMPLTNEKKESYENQQICYICEEEFCTNKNKKRI